MRRHIAPVLMLMSMLASAQNIFTIAGIPKSHRDDVDSQQALSAPLGSVYGLLIDKTTGRLIFNDQLLVLRLEPDGSLLTLAGNGTGGYSMAPLAPLSGGSGSSMLASALTVSVWRGMAEDSSGALYLSDAGAGRVYKVTPAGIVTTFAGGGSLPPGAQSDGGPATSAALISPRGLMFDSKGNLDIAEVFCSCIRRVTPEGIISTVYTLPLPPLGGEIPNIEGLAIDSQDNLYFTEWFGHTVQRVASDGSGAIVIAGTGSPGFSGDGGPATAAQLDGPSGVTLDSSGNIYIADTTNNRIRKVATDGTISTVAGSGIEGTATFGGSVDNYGFSGDGGPALSAQLCEPAEVLFDPSGNLLTADYGNRRVRAIATGGTITTVAGSSQTDPALSFPLPNGNGGPEIHAAFGSMGGAAFDAAGNLYVSDSNTIRKIAASGAVSTFAGTGQLGYSGDGGPAIQAQLSYPGPLSVGPDGSLYVITDYSRVRKITPDGIIHLVAGNGTPTSLISAAQGDGGPAVNATLNEPGGVAFDQNGNIYIADTSNARVRKVDTSGIITTVAGPGQPGVDYYNAVAVDPKGNLYVAWTHFLPPAVTATVNLANPNGSLTPVAGNGQPCTNGPGQITDGAPALQVQLCAVVAMSVDPNGLLNLSEGEYSLVLRLNADGTLQRVAGQTGAMYVGDGGPVLQASLVGGEGWSPEAVTFDPAGNMYIPEPGLNVIRQVTNETYAAALSPNQENWLASMPQNVSIATSANFAEPFPYAVSVSTTSGGSWLSVNRTTGLMGESITATLNPAGLAPGTYHGTIAVVVYISGSSQEVDVPVTLIPQFTQ
jgi:trimeric autotransporter adhesin